MNTDTHTCASHTRSKDLEIRRLFSRLIGAWVASSMRTFRALYPDVHKRQRCARSMTQGICDLLRCCHMLCQREHKDILRRDPKVRARVRRDLGGIPAIAAWEARRRKVEILRKAEAAQTAQTTQTTQTSQATSGLGQIRDQVRQLAQTSPRKHRAKRWTPKTDRYGHYRLAAIPTGRRTHAKTKSLSSYRAYQGYRGYEAGRGLRLLPLEVTSEQLRVPPTFTGSYQSFPEITERCPKATQGRLTGGREID